MRSIANGEYFATNHSGATPSKVIRSTVNAWAFNETRIRSPTFTIARRLQISGTRRGGNHRDAS